MAGLRAHNRWMVDFCAQTPGRRKSPVQIFLYDIDDALAEIRWGHEAGLPTVLVPAVAPNHPLDGMWSRRYDPIWALCQELGMPVNQHVGAGTPDLGRDPAEGAAFMYEVIRALSLKASEYFYRNCLIGASSSPPAEIGCRYDVGIERIMWVPTIRIPRAPSRTPALRCGRRLLMWRPTNAV